MPVKRNLLPTLLACCAWAQDPAGYRVETVAGLFPSQEGVPVNEALFLRPQAIATGSDRTIYISDPFRGIRAIGSDGSVSILQPTIPPTQAIAVDAAGFLYSVQGPEVYVRTPTGERFTYRPFGNLPMPRPAAFTSVAVTQDGTAIVADSNNRVVARVGKDGTAQPIAGLGSRVALDVIPNRLATDVKGNIYIATRSQIFRLTAEGALTLIAGTTASPFSQLGAIACGTAGEIYFVDASTQSVGAINTEGLSKEWYGREMPRISQWRPVEPFWCSTVRGWWCAWKGAGRRRSWRAGFLLGAMGVRQRKRF